MSSHRYRPRALLGAAALFAGLLLAACGGGGGGDAPAAPSSSTEQQSFVYATDYKLGRVLAYSIDAATGRLAPVAGSPFPGGVEAFQAVISPSGKFLYVANCGIEPYTPAEGSNISAYAINPGSGALTPLQGSPFTAGDCVGALAFDATGRFVYALNSVSNDITQFALDASSGALTRAGAAVPVDTGPQPLGTGPQGIAVDPSGKFVVVANGDSGSVSVFSISASTGALTPVPGSPFATGGFAGRINFGAAGRFVHVDRLPSRDPGALTSILTYRFDSTTGELVQPAGSSPFEVQGFDRSVANAAGTVLYVPRADGIGAYAIDPNTGNLTALPGSPYAAGSEPAVATIDSKGRYLYMPDCAANALYGYSIGANGALTTLPGSPFAAATCPYWTASN